MRGVSPFRRIEAVSLMKSWQEAGSFAQAMNLVNALLPNDELLQRDR
jgi:hypothetical protein